MLQINFSPYVGTSPGTTTMGIPSISALNDGLGVCPPGHYGPEIMLPGARVPDVITATDATARYAWQPYATESKLRGRLGRLGATAIRWDLLVLSFGAAFAGILGYTWYRSRRRK